MNKEHRFRTDRLILLGLSVFIICVTAVYLTVDRLDDYSWPFITNSLLMFFLGITNVLLILTLLYFLFRNLIKVLLARFEKATLSLLLGLLLGAVIGLWPFQRSVEPQPGDRVRGRVMTADSIRELKQEDYPLERFSPTGAQIGGAWGLLLAGFLVTQGIALAGGGRGRTLPQEE